MAHPTFPRPLPAPMGLQSTMSSLTLTLTLTLALVGGGPLVDGGTVPRAPSAVTCPAAPAGFVAAPGHCIGDPAHPPNCGGSPLHSGQGCGPTVQACFVQAAAACQGDARCHSFVVEASGGSCGAWSQAGKWHAYAEGNASLVANPQWVAYGRSGGPPPPPPPAPPAPPSPDPLTASFTCMVRRLAAETASARIGSVFGPRLQALLSDALRLHECGASGRAPLGPAHSRAPPTGTLPQHPQHVESVFVAAAIRVSISPTGSDTAGDGTPAKPFRSPLRARDYVRAVRKQRSASGRHPNSNEDDAVGAPVLPAVVGVQPGTYFLGDLGGTLVLGPEDSNVAWVAEAPPGDPSTPSPPPTFSGATLLANLTWEPFQGKIVRATLPAGTPSFASLFGPSGQRLVRSRTPNGNPEDISGLCFMGSDRLPSEGCSAFMQAQGAVSGAKFVGPTVGRVVFNTTRGGVVPGDGVYSQYDVLFQAPPAHLQAEGFPTAVCNQGEGGGELYNRTSAFVWKEDGRGLLDGAGTWKRPEEAVVHMMHNGWGNVMYTVASIHPGNRTIYFERGGYQHGRSGSVGAFWVENQLELLDAPGEWWLDVDARQLYLYPNATGPDASAPAALAAAVLETVVLVNGTQAARVENVSLAGLGFSQTAPTFLAPFERPISGDWAIQRGGAVLVTGAANVSLARCSVTSTGGNGLTFSRHVRRSSVVESEFRLVGDSAIVALGDANWTTGDVRGGDYPSGLVITRNLCHEIGVIGKQTSCFFQGVSGRNRFEDNVCFNGPRALVNINDGAIGQSNISGNVLFNGCRETDDHGNFNSWDRTPLLHLSGAPAGPPTWSPGVSTVSGNLLVNSYGAGHGIDHDDGSEFWHDLANVVGFSHACKGNYGSNRNCSANLVIAPGLRTAYASARGGAAPCAMETNNGHGSTFAGKYFEGNTCVFLADSRDVPAYTFASCEPDPATLNETVWATRSNRFLLPAASQLVVPCGHAKLTLSDWQDTYGQDLGATVAPLPSAGEVAAMARALLGVPAP